MMTAAQMRMLGQKRELDFRRRAVTYLMEAYPEFSALIGPRWSQFLAGAKELADRADLRSELAVMTMCELAAVYGHRFHFENSWASYILFRCEAEPVERVDRLRKYLPRPDRLQPERNHG